MVKLVTKINVNDLVVGRFESQLQYLISDVKKRAFSWVLKTLAATFTVIAPFAPTAYAPARFEKFNEKIALGSLRKVAETLHQSFRWEEASWRLANLCGCFLKVLSNCFVTDS